MVKFFNNLKLRWKLMVVVLPLVIIPIVIVGCVVGYIASHQAYLGVTQTSKDELDHTATFTLDLLQSHYQQLQAYRQDQERTLKQNLGALESMAYSLAATEERRGRSDGLAPRQAQREAVAALSATAIGRSGKVSILDGKGMREMHGAGRKRGAFEGQDEASRQRVREMVRQALDAPAGQVLFTTYQERSSDPGDRTPRVKIAAYRYFKPWDWVIVTSGELGGTTGEASFERRSFAKLKDQIRGIKVGRTGYIYCMDSKGNLTVHPDAEGKNFIDARDSSGHKFIREMCEKKQGWISYPWQNPDDSKPRMKIVRYVYFQPWDWIVAVGSYEDEFYQQANAIKGHTLASMLVLILISSLASITLISYAAKVVTRPIRRMNDVIRRVKQGRFDQQVEIDSNDELGELAATFNRMTEIIHRNQEMEAALAHQGKMASLGVLSSGVAHEINNPLGVILGYASYLEGKLEEDHPHYRYIQEIKRESKRCKKIVQDLLSYARTPKPNLEPTDINLLLGQIIDFAANHTDLHHVRIVRDFAPELPLLPVDGDQLRQVAINLILNAGAALTEEGVLTARTFRDGEDAIGIVFADNGAGIPAEHREKIFEPFFTTKARGTGLGLAITRQIVELHHGRIALESSVGIGTTITITLPLVPEDYR